MNTGSWVLMGLFLFSSFSLAAPKSGGTLRFGISKDISVLNPFLDTRSIEHGVRSLIYEPLVVEDDYKVKAHLAESWEISKDGKEYVFQLRKGVRFHNGKEMTAEDVQWSLTYTTDPKNAAYAASRFGDVKSVEIQSSHRIRITLKEPNVPFLSYLTSVQGLPIVAKESLATAEKPQRFPPGTGPFEFVDWKTGQRIELKKFRSYWRPGISHVDSLILRPVVSDEIRLTALRAGDLDIIERIPNQFVDRIKKGEIRDINLTLAPVGGLRSIYFNNSKPPFNNVKVRQAVAHAIDREEIIRAVYWGLGVPIYQKADPSSPWYFDLPGHKRDLAKARAFLREAGYPNGLKATIKASAVPEESQVIQAQLKKIGIDLEPKVMPFATSIMANRSGNFEMTTSGGSIGSDPDISYYDILRTDKGMQNHVRYSNPRFDALMDEGRVTIDLQKRRQIYREATEILLEEVPIIWTILTPYIYAHRPDVKGFEVEPRGLFFSGTKGIPMIWLDQ